METDDLISRQAALDCFHDWIDKHGDVHTADEMPEYQAIETLPSVDATTVVRGKWIYISDGYIDFYQCSVCGKLVKWSYNFCPRCGSRMEDHNE